MKMKKLTLWASGGSLLLACGALQAVVSDNLLTNSNGTSAWQNCEGSSLVTETVNSFDPAHLEDEGCAYRETPAQAGVQYQMTCGISSFKYSSMTLTFLDADDTTLATQSTEVLENVTGGAYSVTLMAPAGTTTAAIGIYGLAGSGFQDCTLLIDNPGPGPQDGSIAGIAWFDDNADTQLAPSESLIPSTPVSLVSGGVVIADTTTGLDGSYSFGGLDLGACYQVIFAPADPTLDFTAAGGDNDVVSAGTTADICPSVATPNIAHINAGFVAIPPVVPPEDYAVCGSTWLENPAEGEGNAIANIDVTLTNVVTAEQHTVTTGTDGSYSFSSLPGGDYTLQFGGLGGHTFVAGDSSLAEGSSYAGTDGLTPQFNLPNAGNTGADDACTLRNANAGMNRTPVALDPTIANDDEVEGFVGDTLTVLILGNDEPCNGEVSEVNMIGHNVPGNVSYNPATGAFAISGTTASGTYTIDYGLRGSCGSYDTAVVTITIADVPPPPPPMAPAQPALCLSSIGKETSSLSALHIDLKFTAEQPISSFSPEYNFYDVDMNLVYTGLLSEAGVAAWGRYWRTREHGLDVLSIVYVTAVENGVESTPALCARQTVTPIALDIDGTGKVESISGDFNFDITGNGTTDRLMEWFAPGDGILINSDFGAAISGEHLFGDVGGEFVDGFAKLALQDLNKDGKVSGDELQNMAIWTDSNSNTVVDTGEISTLASHSIKSLSVEPYKYAARAELSNGKSLLMQDLWFPLHPIEQASK